jgi:hypothetical protein
VRGRPVDIPRRGPRSSLVCGVLGLLAGLSIPAPAVATVGVGLLVLVLRLSSRLPAI